MHGQNLGGFINMLRAFDYAISFSSDQIIASSFLTTMTKDLCDKDKIVYNQQSAPGSDDWWGWSVGAFTPGGLVLPGHLRWLP